MKTVDTKTVAGTRAKTENSFFDSKAAPDFFNNNNQRSFFSQASGASPANVQMKCAACEQEQKLQRKPIFESDAEPMDEQHVQRKCAECEKKEKQQ